MLRKTGEYPQNNKIKMTHRENKAKTKLSSPSLSKSLHKSVFEAIERIRSARWVMLA